MERHELLERLAPLIPPPRAHQVRYYGILAPSASGRDHVVPRSRPQASTASATPSAIDEAHREARCGINHPRTCRPRGGETGPTTSITTPNESPSARSKADPVSSQGARTAKVPALAQRAAPSPVPSIRSRRLLWADLLKRVFGVEALRCECGHSMRVIAAITEPTVAKRILECMGLASRAPPLQPARASGSAATPWLEEHAAEDFDQTPPDDGWTLDA